MSEPCVTLAQQAAFQRFPAAPTGQDAIDLQEDLDAAIEQVEVCCGPVAQAERTYTVRPKRNKLVLPVVMVTAVGTVTSPDGVVVEPYDVDLEAGIIVLPTWPATEKAWTVGASTGNDVKSLVLAVKHIASHLYGIRRGHAALPGGRAYPTVDDATVTVAGFAIPRRAADLMAPYLRSGR